MYHLADYVLNVPAGQCGKGIHEHGRDVTLVDYGPEWWLNMKGLELVRLTNRPA